MNLDAAKTKVMAKALSDLKAENALIVFEDKNGTGWIRYQYLGHGMGGYIPV